MTDVGFIRIFFRDQIEEEIAHRWASRLDQIVGPLAQQLRPETTLEEMLSWAANRAESFDFMMVFEPELRGELAAFLADARHATFRAMVQHYAKRFQPDCGSES